ncbi:hypothetical protein [Phytomonospora endophytica]|uniref:Uncharacterized protein n=1 Tax=Phytomonospora endophytica TaxID=714109 RepID=A0A841FB99_9ACTN|nr:hypothetical protein [Phytomonospora endophytica]MBB6033054.1 hypothetical protein [Phytomonospora endophytica]GIG65281.1 hypothetical protein Pen01_15760 [Phytomonospora endophytica]
MDSEPNLPTITETVAEIRRQLIAAQAASRADADKNKRVPFPIAEAEAELGITAVRDGDAVRVGVVAANGEATHHVRIRFEPRSKNAAMYEVSDDGDDDDF